MGSFKYRIGIIFFVILATALAAYFFSLEEAEESLEEINLTDKKLEILKEIVGGVLNIPFTPQAPYADWDNSIYQDGCEEASSLMAVYWTLGKELNKEIADREIRAISKYETENFGGFVDTSAQDTAKRIIQGYFGYSKAEVKENIVLKDIISEIEKGHAVIVPVNGQLLGNPYFTQPGPERHNLVIKGYDIETKEFITNDPGTKRGESYRYDENILFNAIRDYPTGDHSPIKSIEKNMIIVIR
ncbi:MAG: C39 family peptidase [Candidatus Portnoybacteria bacterium]